ncbi:MAG: hypothetical protein IIA53_09635 [Chloroflexi bacterium]|nr:hypothetical protein [Chloroflexota bacterium]
MNFFGIGGLEFLLLGAIALFVLGPKRLLEGIREGRRLYSNLRRQRAELQSMITEAIDLEEIKKQVDSEGLAKEAAALQEDLALDQIAEDVKNAADINSGSVSRSRQLNRPPVKGNDDVRAAIPDLKLSGSAGSEAASSSVNESEVDEVKS